MSSKLLVAIAKNDITYSFTMHQGEKVCWGQVRYASSWCSFHCHLVQGDCWLVDFHYKTDVSTIIMEMTEKDMLSNITFIFEIKIYTGSQQPECLPSLESSMVVQVERKVLNDLQWSLLACFVLCRMIFFSVFEILFLFSSFLPRACVIAILFCLFGRLGRKLAWLPVAPIVASSTLQN